MGIRQLLEHGLARPGFVPPKEIRSRELSPAIARLKNRGARTGEIQRLDKVPRDAGIEPSLA